MYERFRSGETAPESVLGSSRDYNIDTVPKFIMANGKLVRVLVKTTVTRYLEFKAVDGSFVYNKGKICRVPATDLEALKSQLMGMFEKRRARKFFLFVQSYDMSKEGIHEGLNLNQMTMAQLYQYYQLEDATIEFIGHALALHANEDYINEAALPTVLKIKLYHDSLMRFAGMRSPYIYPLYGLGELPQAFARLSAVHGGTYMLNKPDVEVIYEEGKVVGVKSEDKIAKCGFVVGDPSYFPGKTQRIGQVVRAFCIMDHPIPDTNDAYSVQIILPQNQIKRKSDMYVFCCSYAHSVAPQGKWLAFVSTTVETEDPESELQPGLALLGPILEKFVEVKDVYGPTDDGKSDHAFISTGYDASTHFEATIDDVLDVYKRITGKVLDLESEDPMVAVTET
eukprot:g6614.t1